MSTLNIICFSNQLWDWPLWTNKRQVMARLANLGHNVLFVDPPIRIQKLVKQVVGGQWSLSRLVTGDRVVKTEFEENKELINYTPLTFSYSEDPNLIGFNVRRLLTGRHTGRPLQSKRSEIGSELPRTFQQKDGKTILWVYNVSMREYVDKIPHDFLIYDCVDDYPSMANYERLGLSDQVKTWEEELTKKADLVFGTTPGLVEKLSKLNANTHFVPNAGNYELFSKVTRQNAPKPEALASISAPIIGFTGTIDDYKVDTALIVKTARQYPQYSFVIIGPRGETDKSPDLSILKTLANVHFLSEIKYEAQASYYAYFDAFIIPYRLNNYTVKGCFPVKFFDALSAGLPTIVTNLPAYKAYKDVCYIGRTEEDFVKMVGQAVTEDSLERRQARQVVAKDNSWDGKVTKMLAFLSS